MYTYQNFSGGRIKTSTDTVVQKNNGSSSGLCLVDYRLGTVVQKKRTEALKNYQPTQYTIQKKQNRTGLPYQLKTGIENLSGYSMDGVKLHYNSLKPAQLDAHAYAQGNEIHIAAGQEKHLAHEAWHVIQQKQGRVKSTVQLKDIWNVNEDQGLEKEADTMGKKALQFKYAFPGISQRKTFSRQTRQLSQVKITSGASAPVQLHRDDLDEKFQKLNDVFEGLKKDFEGKKEEIDALMEALPVIPLSHKYLQNRWEHYKPEFEQYFEFDPKTLLDPLHHVKSQNTLRRFQNKLNWYQSGGDGRSLLWKTYEQVTQDFPVLIERREHVDRIEGRMQAFNQLIGDGHEVGNISPANVNKINSISMDPNRQKNISLTEVEDNGPTINSPEEREAASDYLMRKHEEIPPIWQNFVDGAGPAPFGLSAPKFRNQFGADTIVMSENYRPPWHRYFASDVFFTQWLAAVKNLHLGNELPKKFPSVFYRNNVSNSKTVEVMQALLDEKDTDVYLVYPGDLWWDQLVQTPNGASTINILQEYSEINLARGGGRYGVRSIQIYRKLNMYQMKFNTGSIN